MHKHDDPAIAATSAAQQLPRFINLGNKLGLKASTLCREDLLQNEEVPMMVQRREILTLAGAAALAGKISGSASAQGTAGPKLTQLLRADLQGQAEKVQETIVSLLEMPAGVSAPWHMHPGAQELLFAIDGDFVIEVEGQGSKIIKAGAVGLIPAEIPHLARNDGSSLARALVTHSRAEKEKTLTVIVKRAG
jgi:quercetin dioxygenase-like cupin family protein